MAPEHPLASLLSRLRADPGQPLLVWHQQSSGARVELSSASAWNYVCKAANLLCEEFEVGPGSLVDVRLPAHWQSICWVLAAWALGARVSQGGAGGDADAIVMTRRCGSSTSWSSLAQRRCSPADR
ncbi:MAG: hypothetical protein EB027_05170 [Actinobacteria bacterium]|nr:hypothetical protein [Actinomycetota bacterium]